MSRKNFKQKTTSMDITKKIKNKKKKKDSKWLIQSLANAKKSQRKSRAKPLTNLTLAELEKRKKVRKAQKLKDEDEYIKAHGSTQQKISHAVRRLKKPGPQAYTATLPSPFQSDASDNSQSEFEVDEAQEYPIRIQRRTRMPSRVSHSQAVSINKRYKDMEDVKRFFPKQTKIKHRDPAKQKLADDLQRIQNVTAQQRRLARQRMRNLPTVEHLGPVMNASDRAEHQRVRNTMTSDGLTAEQKDDINFNVAINLPDGPRVVADPGLDADTLEEWNISKEQRSRINQKMKAGNAKAQLKRLTEMLKNEKVKKKMRKLTKKKIQKKFKMRSKDEKIEKQEKLVREMKAKSRAHRAAMNADKAKTKKELIYISAEDAEQIGRPDEKITWEELEPWEVTAINAHHERLRRGFAQDRQNSRKKRDIPLADTGNPARLQATRRMDHSMSSAAHLQMPDTTPQRINVPHSIGVRPDRPIPFNANDRSSDIVETINSNDNTVQTGKKTAKKTKSKVKVKK